MRAAMLYRLSQSTATIDRLKLTFPERLFSPEKVFFATGKCREILVTVHDTTGSIYSKRNATKAYRLVRKANEDVLKTLFR